jgi:hypothetical protein
MRKKSPTLVCRPSMSLTTKTLKHVVLAYNLPRGVAVDRGKVAEVAQTTAQAEAPHAALAAQPSTEAASDTWVALPLRSLAALGEGQKSESPGSEARGRRGLGQQAIKPRSACFRWCSDDQPFLNRRSNVTTATAPPNSSRTREAVRHKITMSGLIALCGLALFVQHVAERGSNIQGGHLIAGALMLTLAVIVWFLPSEPSKD